ncbi:MAG: hypothetical protein V7713_15795 [Marinobacter sp.]
MPSHLRMFTVLAIGIIILAADALAENAPQQRYPDVISAKVRATGDNSFDFDVTLSSPYDTPQRYADAFRVMGKDGTLYGERILLHDHAAEQPFTRSLHAVKVPKPVSTVVIQGRDQRFGYGGKTVEVALPRR